MLKEQVKIWERELREEGIREGIEKGKAEGEAEGEAKLLVRILENKFGTISAELRQRIGRADSEQLLTWAERILTVEKVEDVFDA